MRVAGIKGTRDRSGRRDRQGFTYCYLLICI